MDSTNANFIKKDYHTSLLWAYKAVQQAENEYGKADIYYIKSIELIGLIFKSSGNDDSTLFYQNLTANLKEEFRKNTNPMSVNYLITMASIQKQQCRYNESENLLQKSLEIYKLIFSGDNYYIINCHILLGVLYFETSKLEKAEAQFNEAKEMAKRLYKTDNLSMVSILNGLALVNKEQGLYSKAEEQFRESANMAKRLKIGDNIITSQIIQNLAVVLQDQGKLDEALKYYSEALEINRKHNPNNQNLVYILLNKAGFLKYIGKTKEAETLLYEALDSAKKLFKENHLIIAMCLLNLAELNEQTNNYSEAEEFYKKSFEMLKSIYKNENNKYSANCLSHLAILYFKKNEPENAEALFIESLDLYHRYFIDNDINLSESEKEQFWKTMKENFEVFNNFATQRYRRNPSVLSGMYNFQLFTKGLLLSSSLRMKNNIINSGDKELIRKYEEWLSLKNLIAKRQYDENTGPGNDIKLDSLNSDANKREKELSSISESFSREINKKKIQFGDIQSYLKKDEAAIEIVRFRVFGKEKWLDSICYAALIIRQKALNDSQKISGNIRLVLLKNGHDLEEKYITNYKKCILNKLPDEESYEQFWAKIEKELYGIKKVYFSPDGVYNQLNLLTLQNPKTKKFVINDIDIRIVGSTRDLVERKEIPLGSAFKKGEKIAELYGNPNFNLDSNDYNQIVSRYIASSERSFNYNDKEIDSTTRKGIAPLPGTQTEIENISSILKNNNWIVNKHFGFDAVEESVKSIKNPLILHIATHGLFLKDIESNNDNMLLNTSQSIRENPLMRSMLLLSGAENSLKKEGNRNKQADDGLLTAYEVMNLNLDKTELVVLSACETGLGEIKNGEGVYGLQRAFQQAGAKSLIMSLWKVNDQTTQVLMTSFYSKWMTGKSKRVAFKEAQLELKKKYPEPYYWGAFVMVGE